VKFLFYSLLAIYESTRVTALTQVPIELAVIINSFNRLSLLRQVLPSITQALEFLTLKSVVIVFDAGSTTDGSVEFIKNFSTHTQKHRLFTFVSADMDRF